MDSIAKEENIPLEDLDREGGRRFGRKIGMKLMVKCPLFVDLIAEYGDKEESEVTTGSITDLIVSNVRVSDHIYLDIKDPSGEVHSLIWLEYFPGADKYKSNPADLKRKKVEVEWKETKIYLIAKKDFSTVKEITKLTVK